MSAGHDHRSERCLELFERLSEYLDGDLPPALCAEIEEHMAGCEPCVRFLASLRNTVAHVGAVPSASMPDEWKRECIEAFEKRFRNRGQQPV